MRRRDHGSRKRDVVRERRPLAWLSVAALRLDIEPLEVPVWIGTARIPVEEVQARIAAGGLERPAPCDAYAAEPRGLHIERIAYYAAFGWGDAPILVLVGQMFGSPWAIDDGHHRLSAAIVRGQKTLLAELDCQRAGWPIARIEAYCPAGILATEEERAHDLARGLTDDVPEAATRDAIKTTEAVAPE